jgi:Flp pilus assembly protein TadG
MQRFAYARRRRSYSRSERGQSMVEMALMMTILLVILSGVLDLGRGFFSFIAIQNAAAEGALYAAINPRCRDATVTGCADPNNVLFRARHESPEGLVDKQRMTVELTCHNNNTSCEFSQLSEGHPITVTVVYQFQMLGPFSAALPDGHLYFKAHAVQNILDLK